MSDRVRASYQDDDALLAVLGAVLVPTGLCPTDEGLRRLAWDVAERGRSAGVASFGRGRRRRRAPIVVAMAAAVAWAGSSIAAGDPLPRPLRVIAAAVGLPVTPPAVADVNAAMSALVADLHAGTGASEAQTARDIEALAAAVHALDPRQRAEAGATAERLLEDACGVLAGRAEPVDLPDACAAVTGAPSAHQPEVRSATSMPGAAVKPTAVSQEGAAQGDSAAITAPPASSGSETSAPNTDPSASPTSAGGSPSSGLAPVPVAPNDTSTQDPGDAGSTGSPTTSSSDTTDASTTTPTAGTTTTAGAGQSTSVTTTSVPSDTATADG